MAKVRDGSVHPTALLGQGVMLGPDCRIGPQAVLGDGVVLGAGTSIGVGAIIEDHAHLGESVVVDHRALVRRETCIGDRCMLGAGSITGQWPTRARTSTLKDDGGLSPLVIADDCQIGAGAVIYAGSVLSQGCFIADGAQVRERCELGNNVIVGHAATVENDCRVGNRTKIQTGVYLTAFSEVEDDVFLAPMVTTTNDNFVGRTAERFRHRKGAVVRRGGRVGGNAVLLPGVVIGQEALVAAGSVVTSDVPAYQTVMGVPARVKRPVPPEQLLYPKPEEDSTDDAK